MRARRGVYAAIFLVAALASAALVYAAQPRNGIVRAKVDIAFLTPITADMVELVQVSPADAPANAARSLDDVVGRYASVAILAGQDVDRRILEDTPGQRTFGFGAPLEAGQVAFALPVEPGQAVGGALVPGARVDVVAVPNALKTQLSSGADSLSAVMLGQGLVVLTIRTPEGEPLTDQPEAERGSVVIPPKLGSVVVAIRPHRSMSHQPVARRPREWTAPGAVGWAGATRAGRVNGSPRHITFVDWRCRRRSAVRTRSGAGRRLPRNGQAAQSR